MTEAVTHYGESIKAIMNEELGDGIMSAIDMYATVRSYMSTYWLDLTCADSHAVFKAYHEVTGSTCMHGQA